ncbi:uncharacterized protein ATNIH1004_001648 [Aspergillus tanneri]|uniref:Uncharacterized protein n=1 Tax=Aspergillus tanneri TaxID=1220188 RepID=A0A5M9N628_9EURO|nr:uncharacterized protein ATNIH1004_001648 [Aspergillus tanneri]KAA8652743.1 hypothetical protein ATNIH1004_001648 [Aspergillus tanneri]
MPAIQQDRKPILKKRTLSEAIPKQPLLQQTLLYARPSLKAQKTDNDRNRTSSNCHKSNLGESLRQVSGVSPQTPFIGTPANTSSAGFGSPRHHVHFNNEVVQCVAVKADSDEEDESPTTFENDSSPGNGVVMTGQHITHIYSCDKNSTSRNGISSRKKTIAPLPSTTLSFRGDSPEPQAGSVWSRGFGQYSASTASSASFVETLPTYGLSADFTIDYKDLDFNFHTKSFNREDNLREHMARVHQRPLEY